MSTRLLEGTYDGTHLGHVALVDSTTGWAFGPVFESREDAEAFLAGCRPRDPKRLSAAELEIAVWRFRQSRKVREGPACQGGSAGPAERASGSAVVGPGAEGR